MLNEEVLQYIEKHWEEGYELLLLLRSLRRLIMRRNGVEFCKNWLEEMGAKGVYVDEALNVVYPYQAEEDKPSGGIYGPHGCGISGYHTSPIKRGGRKDLLSRRW